MTEFITQLCSQRQVKCKQRKNYSQRAERKELRPGAAPTLRAAAAPKLPHFAKKHTPRAAQMKNEIFIQPKQLIIK